MNEFTKDELEWLYHEVTVIKNNHKHTHEVSIPLQSKIQSLIDNYCEHSEEYEDFNYSPMRCKECLEITG